VTDQYEFSPDEEETIATLAGAMQNVGMVGLFGGMLGLLRELYALAFLHLLGFTLIASLGLVVTVLPIVIAALMIGGGRTLMKIAHTEGEDVALLVRGIDRLTLIYVLEAIVALAAFGVIGWLSWRAL
jgi:hypothetical protein